MATAPAVDNAPALDDAPAADIARVGNCNAPTCVSRAVLDHLASRWGSLVLRALMRGERRYSELRGIIGGISEKMLAQTLRELERDGLISRTSYPVVPPHVVYALTPLGEECAAHIGALVGWIETHVRELARARRAYDAVPRKRQPATQRAV
jgi:DNA-binding HxlR family transcriptional regulator